jgi:hypothetical protein
LLKCRLWIRCQWCRLDNVHSPHPNQSPHHVFFESLESLNLLILESEICHPQAAQLHLPWTVDCGLWTVDRGPWTVDRGLIGGD